MSLFLNLCFTAACLSNIIHIDLLCKYPINSETAYFSGISINIYDPVTLLLSAAYIPAFAQLASAISILS